MKRLANLLILLCLLAPVQAETAVKIVLPPSLETERGAIESQIAAGHVRLRSFAEKYGWQKHLQKSLYDEVVVYDDKSKLDQALRDSLGAPEGFPVPESFVGTLQERKLIIAGPDLYLEINPDAKEVKAYEKLLCRELSHELHTRVLDGDEYSLGPLWFSEGFGIVASGQFQDLSQALSEDEIWAVLETDEQSGDREYAQVMHYFLESATLPQLVERAGKPDFSDYLAKLKER